MPTETQLVTYLKKKYSPKVIALGGSRAAGVHRRGSDWDLFLFCEKSHQGGFFTWKGELLDITFHEWPKPRGWAFTTPFGPVWPVKILYDGTQGAFDGILKRTKDVHDRGPLKAYADGCAMRLQKLERWFGKLQKHEKEHEMQFYYIGFVYEFVLRLWFEQQNRWPLPPAQSIPFIHERDRAFWKLLHAFMTARGKRSVTLAARMMRRLKSLKGRVESEIVIS